jgi:hypothetical protein
VPPWCVRALDMIGMLLRAEKRQRTKTCRGDFALE